MKFISSFIFCLIVILIGVNVNAAKVNNVDVYYENGKTCAAIEVDGTIRFTHQIEDAKDGKPFRIIVDILSATHNLGAKSFVNLPKSSILKIRSSQYCVKPENVVRVVFDMAHESVYSIDLSGNVVKVSIPDKSTKSFERWSSKKFLAGLKPKKESKQKLTVKKETKKQSKTFAQINNSIEQDRLASLGSKKTKKQTKTTVKIVAKESKQNYGPKFDPKLLAAASSSKIKTEKK
ncbi:MAG: AMIN domain-containing protein, partial [candidate division Zixibacteria bacterium]|nr:AMIN domain-containing protein [candidate division Zixibacteria bacterium]